MPHPPIALLDTSGRDVLRTGRPVSTRASCGPCHDYGFITESVHFQQGRDEMTPVLLAERGLGRYHASPGMFGKYAFFTNRQLARRDAESPQDFDMGTPEWLMRCGGCHGGGGPAERDLEGRPYESTPPDAVAPLDPGYHIRDAEADEIRRWEWSASGVAEADCFLCHLPGADFEARRETMARGEFAWAATATLSGSGPVLKDAGGGYRYDATAWGPEGKVLPARLPLTQPRTENCGFCHGFTARDATTIPTMEVGEVMRCAEKAGWIFSGTLIGDTRRPTIAGKEELDIPWDVHAAAGLECVDCHFSPNNPARRPRADAANGLTYRPGGEDPAMYLRRPDHNLARGLAQPLTVDLGKRPDMRGCEDCHDTSRTHLFLPFKKLHFSRLACKACHIPFIHFWAYRSQEWVAPTGDGGPRTFFRGIRGAPSDPRATVTGYEPAFAPYGKEGRPDRLRPVNPISGLYWFDRRKRRPVFTWQLRRAFLERDEVRGTWRPRPGYLRALDEDGDGTISDREARLNSAGKVEALASMLWTFGGIEAPELRCTVVPWSMSHSVAPGSHALRDCLACHGPRSVLRSAPPLTDCLPPGTRTFFVSQEMPVARTAPEGGASFDNGPLLGGFYILGNTRVPLVEGLGRGAVLLAALGCAVHRTLRTLRGRRR